MVAHSRLLLQLEQEGGAEKHQLIVRAIAFAYQILRNARNTSNDMIAVIAAGQDKDGASVRAYWKRPGEFWIDEDLEKVYRRGR